jgi:hypothetical protein
MSEDTSEPKGEKNNRDIDWAYINEQHRIWKEEHKDEKPVWWSI